MSRSRRFPPSPERYPFFYGWVIVAVGTLGVVSSIPGQTMGVSVFAPRLMEALRLSSTQLSIAYGIGTVASGLFLVRAGRLVDRFGVRRAMIFASVCSALALLFLSSSGIVAEGVSSALGSGTHTAVAMIVITLGFFFLRFFGQGMSAMVPRVMIGKWFHRRRGLAVGGIRDLRLVRIRICTRFFQFSRAYLRLARGLWPVGASGRRGHGLRGVGVLP